MNSFDVIVIGAGHAGIEAALASARLGCSTAVLTINLDNVGLMPCNCSIGGPAKGHVVREVDALGGQMALTTDETLTHIRMLNTGKGPARAGATSAVRQEDVSACDEKRAGIRAECPLQAGDGRAADCRKRQGCWCANPDWGRDSRGRSRDYDRDIPQRAVAHRRCAHCCWARGRVSLHQPSGQPTRTGISNRPP